MARSKLAQMKGLSRHQLDPIAGGVGVVTSDTKSKEEQTTLDALAMQVDVDDVDDDDGQSGTNVGVSGTTGVGLFAAETGDAQGGSTDTQGPVVATGLG